MCRAFVECTIRKKLLMHLIIPRPRTLFHSNLSSPLQIGNGSLEDSVDPPDLDPQAVPAGEVKPGRGHIWGLLVVVAQGRDLVGRVGGLDGLHDVLPVETSQHPEVSACAEKWDTKMLTLYLVEIWTLASYRSLKK